MKRSSVATWLALTVTSGCGGSGDATTELADSASPDTVGGGPDTPVTSEGRAARIARRLRGTTNFLIGMGNDLAANHDNDGAYALGVTLDLHYTYLVGLKGAGGWTDWNAGGSFVNVMTDAALKHGVTPMFTLYSMAAWGDGNLTGLEADLYMKPYWEGAKLLFQRVAAFGKPTVVHFEPDFWAYAQLKGGGDATKVKVKVASLAPDCADLANDATGLGRCLVKLARTYAPNAVIGFHASAWAGPTAQTIAFLEQVGASEADVIVIDVLDRDAGCLEAAVDPNCKRGGVFYWDAANVKSPNFHEHLAWTKQIGDGLRVPILWWQVPFGVPSETPGGSAGHYRDNRVKYVFDHPDEWVAAGGVGVAFGTGAGNQTYITTDDGQFKNAVTKYLAKPLALP